MPTVRRLPNLRALVDPLLGTSYAEYTCWGLVYYLLKEGLRLDLARDPATAATALMEIWFRGDPRNPLTLVQPWDLYITTQNLHLPVSDHVGLVVDDTSFVHARNVSTGVAIEPLRRWRPKLLQLARARSLL